MPKIESAIKAEIVRLAKREMRSAFLPMKREVRQIRIRLSGLSKAITSLNRLAKDIDLKRSKPKLEASPEEVISSRITPARIRGLRKKLGISQKQMGILTGASIGAVLSWERGKFKPRGDKKTALVALRKMGKRQVKELLQEKASSNGKKPEAKVSPRRKTPRRPKLQVKKIAGGKKPPVKRVRLAVSRVRRAA